jgi:hypothetical protein
MASRLPRGRKPAFSPSLIERGLSVAQSAPVMNSYVAAQRM